MSEIRKIRKIVTGERAVDGAGVKTGPQLGHRDTNDFDPFLMLDAFDSELCDETFIKQNSTPN